MTAAGVVSHSEILESLIGNRKMFDLQIVLLFVCVLGCVQDLRECRHIEVDLH